MGFESVTSAETSALIILHFHLQTQLNVNYFMYTSYQGLWTVVKAFICRCSSAGKPVEKAALVNSLHMYPSMCNILNTNSVFIDTLHQWYGLL